MQHQSLILDDRYMFVFFGMCDQILLTDTMEYVDLHRLELGFKEIHV